MSISPREVLRVPPQVVAFCLLFLVSSCQPWTRNRTLRIATNDSIPFNYWDPKTDQATGFAIDVLNAAAARAGYKLQWVHSSQGPEATIASGQADFWPFVTYSEERKADLELSEPWWRIGTVAYFDRNTPIQTIQDVLARRVAVTSPGRRYFPKQLLAGGPKIKVFVHSGETLASVCKGESDVALVDYRAAEEVLLDRPEVCEKVKFGSRVFDEYGRRFSIGARKGRSREVLDLRQAIDALAETGEIMAIAERWKILNKSDYDFVEWLHRNQDRNRLLRYTIVAGFVILVAMLVLLHFVLAARREADRNARARSQFLANMSHEIRTPMNGILGMTELTLASELTQEQRTNLNMARDSAESLLRILDDVLDFSRVESGKLSLERIPFSLADALGSALEVVRPKAEAKGLQLGLELDPQLPGWLLGDPVRLKQVLWNLLGNAVKFTSEGTILIRCQQAGQEGAQRTLSFSVEDTGIGIAPEKLAEIFQPFTQADASTTRRFGGTGLGLTISAELVRLMGGRLEVDSRPGQGSRFYFTLTLEETPERTPAPMASPAREVPQSARILIAEDNSVNRLLLERILARQGYGYLSVSNGQLAVEAAQKERFDVILMDVHMPIMDGYDATKAIRSLDQALNRRTTIVALTALAVEGDKEKCLQAGMDAYLAKPLRHEDLLALLQNMLSKSSIAKPAVDPIRS